MAAGEYFQRMIDQFGEPRNWGPGEYELAVEIDAAMVDVAILRAEISEFRDEIADQKREVRIEQRLGRIAGAKPELPIEAARGFAAMWVINEDRKGL